MAELYLEFACDGLDEIRPSVRGPCQPRRRRRPVQHLPGRSGGPHSRRSLPDDAAALARLQAIRGAVEKLARDGESHEYRARAFLHDPSEDVRRLPRPRDVAGEGRAAAGSIWRGICPRSAAADGKAHRFRREGSGGDPRGTWTSGKLLASARGLCARGRIRRR